MRQATIVFDQFGGANYNPGRTRGLCTDDFNGRHWTEGAWQARLGLARGSGLTAIGQQVLGLAQHVDLVYALQSLAVQGDGKLVGAATPSPGWIT